MAHESISQQLADLRWRVGELQAEVISLSDVSPIGSWRPSFRPADFDDVNLATGQVPEEGSILSFTPDDRYETVVFGG